jgi:hypothetical protein
MVAAGAQCAKTKIGEVVPVTRLAFPARERQAGDGGDGPGETPGEIWSMLVMSWIELMAQSVQLQENLKERVLAMI